MNAAPPVPRLTFLLALLAGCAGAPAQAENRLEGGQQRALVAAHDHWRAEVGVPAVRWSAALGTAAQEWADRLGGEGCAMRHAPRTQLGDTGENLFWAGPIRWSDGRTEVQPVSPEQVVDSWGSEKRDYDAVTNRCAPGQICSHYTQVVWRDSREIGCAMAQCADQGQVWVCRYRPAGNVVGRRPY